MRLPWNRRSAGEPRLQGVAFSSGIHRASPCSRELRRLVQNRLPVACSRVTVGCRPDCEDKTLGASDLRVVAVRASQRLRNGNDVCKGFAHVCFSMHRRSRPGHFGVTTTPEGRRAADPAPSLRGRSTATRRGPVSGAERGSASWNLQRGCRGPKKVLALDNCMYIQLQA